MRLSAALLAASALVAATPALATNITGSVFFNGGTTNFFDPQYSFATGFGNSAGTTVMVGPGVEFGLNEVGANLDTADFTATSLLLTDIKTTTGTNFSAIYTFTADTAGFFSNAALASNTLGGTFSVSGNTLTYRYPGGNLAAGAQSALITFAGGTPAVPEPATWAMMILGMGAVGYAMRRRRKVAVRVSYAA